MPSFLFSWIWPDPPRYASQMLARVCGARLYILVVLSKSESGVETFTPIFIVWQDIVLVDVVRS